MQKGVYDVIVVGGGTAGSNAARAAKKAGAGNVALVRKPDMWNTCVQVGCMPTKSILAAARNGMPFVEIMKRKDAHIERLERSLDDSLHGEDFEIIEGPAVFKEDDVLHVGEKILTAQRYVLATGASAFTPPVEGLRELPEHLRITSDDIAGKNSTLAEAPKSLIILGGGPIGLEMATFFSLLGTEVTIVEMDDVLGTLDEDFQVERIRAAQESDTFNILTDSTMESIAPEAGGVSSRIKTRGETEILDADMILVAAGRKPNLDMLAVEKLGITLRKGSVPHNEKTLQSNENERVFLAGDVAGHHQILHMTAEMGKVAGYNAAVGRPERSVNYDAIALTVVFEEFASAQIGLTEHEARERGIEVEIAQREFSKIGRGILDGVDFGLWKLVAEKQTGRILGAEILGPHHAGELVQLLTPILYNANTVQDVVKMTWYHPTYAEILKSLANDICKQDDTIYSNK